MINFMFDYDNCYITFKYSIFLQIYDRIHYLANFEILAE
jgi:hypothetical protein